VLGVPGSSLPAGATWIAAAADSESLEADGKPRSRGSPRSPGRKVRHCGEEGVESAKPWPCLRHGLQRKPLTLHWGEQSFLSLPKSNHLAGPYSGNRSPPS